MKTKVLVCLLVLFALTACSSKSNTPVATLPTVVLDSGDSTSSAPLTSSGGVTASGMVVPDYEAQLAFTLGGNVKLVNVALGDQVEAGQVLAELDNAAAQMQLNQAERTLREMTSPAAIAAAAQAVATAQQDLEDAQNSSDSIIYPRASDELIKNTQGEIDLAKQQVARAADAYRQVARLPDGNPKKATALVAMTDAQLHLNSLIAKYNWYTGTPSDIDAAKAQADKDAAKAALQEAQWFLSALKGEQIPDDATGSSLAALEQAKDNLRAAQENLDATRLISPISGTVAVIEVIPGDYAPPGRILAVVIDTTKLHVETTDLSERDVSKVQVGQQVTVFVKATNEEITGRVTAISPLADTLGGDVVYKTTIQLDSLPEGLLAGMSVDVQFE
jgi:HlyD family secretion protein